MIDPKINEETLSITFPAASPEPYERYDKETGSRYFERLICTPEAVNLDRLKAGASVLKNHDPDDILGVVEDAWIEEGRLVVRARFRRNSFAAGDTFRDIVDGTLRNVSIGYFPETMVPVFENGVEFRDVTRWTVFEVSVAVGVPADPTVGFYRSAEKKEIPTMDDPNKSPEEEVKACGEAEEEKAETPAAVEAEEDKACDDPAEEVKAEEPAEEVKEEEEDPVEADKPEAQRAAAPVLPEPPKTQIRSFAIPTTKGVTMKQQYSLVRAFQSLVNPKVDASYERSISDALYASSGIPTGPNSIMLSFREGEFIDSVGNGAGLVGVEHRGDMFVEALRPRMGLKNARVISGLRTPISIPVQTGVSSIGVTGLNDAVSRTRPTVVSNEMRPKKFGAETVIGRDLLLQGNPDAISIVVNDLQAEIARKLDLAGFKGIDNPDVPGIDGTTGVQTVTVADMEQITYRDVLSMYGKVADYELEEGSLAFAAKGTTKALLMGIPKETHTGRFICDENGTINGFPLNVCGSLESSDLYFGCFPFVYIGQWGGLEVMVDPYTGMSSGSVKIVATINADILVTRPAAFVKVVGPVSA